MNLLSYKSTGYAIYFEDLRQETNSKYSLMGIYDGAIAIYDPLPYTFSSFGIFIHYYEPREIAITKKGMIYFQVYFPWDENEKPSVEIPAQFEETVKSSPPPEEGGEFVSLISFRIPIMMRNFVVHKAGFIRIRATLDSEIIPISAIQILHQPREQAPQE
jgi:hypothetical protein